MRPSNVCQMLAYVFFRPECEGKKNTVDYLDAMDTGKIEKVPYIRVDKSHFFT